MDDVLAGAFSVLGLDHVAYQRVRELQSIYADNRIGFVDAAVPTLVERLGEPKLATLDHRHFAAMRPAHVPSLQLLP